MPSPSTPQSEITLSPITSRTRRFGDIPVDALNQLRNRKGSDPIASALSSLLSRIEDIEAVLRSSAPSVSSLVLDSADIGSLRVGWEFGPGELGVYSGPPDYDLIGWLGSLDSSSSVTVTSANGGTGVVTTAAPHLLEIGDRVRIEGGTDWNWRGWWKVVGVGSATQFTVAGPPGTSGTGGQMFKQFSGGHLEMLAVGGDVGDPESAPLFCSPQGKVKIGKGGNVSLVDQDEEEVGFLGPLLDPPAKAITAWAVHTSGRVMISIPAHGWRKGNKIKISGGGAGDGKYVIEPLDANSLILRGTTAADLGAGGTATRFFAGVWGQTLASAGSGPFEASLQATEEGLFLSDLEIDLVGEIDSVPFHLEMGPDRIRITSNEGLANETYMNLNGEGVVLHRDSLGIRDSVYNWEGLALYEYLGPAPSDNVQFLLHRLALDGVEMKYSDKTGALLYHFKTNGEVVFNEKVTIDNLDLISPLAIADGGTGATTIAAAQTALNVPDATVNSDQHTILQLEIDALDSRVDALEASAFDPSNYYTKAQVDVLLANKASLSHGHNTISISATFGGGVAHHTHSGTVS